MGIHIEIDENKVKILSVLSRLVDKLNWYKDFINDFEVPESTEGFYSRSVDLLRDVDNITKSIEKFQECNESGNYNYSLDEMRVKILQAQVMLRYINLY